MKQQPTHPPFETTIMERKSLNAVPSDGVYNTVSTIYGSTVPLKLVIWLVMASPITAGTLRKGKQK